MKNRNRILLPVFAAALLVACGCESKQPSPASTATRSIPATSGPSQTTMEGVRKIVSEQMGVSIAKLHPTTSLGELGADELDFVELIMMLEESFSITISDDAAEALGGDGDWQKKAKNVTIQELAALVDNRKSKPNRAVKPNDGSGEF